MYAIRSYYGKALAIGAPSSFVERIMLNFTDPNKETVDGERSSLLYSHPILSDLVVRQAIAMAINREAIAAPYGRGGTLTTNILAEPPTYASANSKFDYDPNKAAELLDHDTQHSGSCFLIGQGCNHGGEARNNFV